MKIFFNYINKLDDYKFFCMIVIGIVGFGKFFFINCFVKVIFFFFNLINLFKYYV